MYRDSIAFPNLHIVFEHVGKRFNLPGGFTIAYYGCVIALGMFVAFQFIMAEARRKGMPQEDAQDMFIGAILCGIVGARIYYVAFSWDAYKDDWLSILNIRGGGLAIYGGIIGGTLAVFCICLRKKRSFLESMDVLIPGVPIGQIFGRWGNFFNREAFGGYTNNPLAMRLPVEAVRSRSDITKEMLAHAKTIDGLQCVQVHPTFLYESLWNIGVLFILLKLGKNKAFSGQLFFFYLLLYGVGRFLIEGLRTDQLLLWGTRLPVSQLLAAALVLASGLAILVSRLVSGGKPK